MRTWLIALASLLFLAACSTRNQPPPSSGEPCRCDDPRQQGPGQY